MGYSIVGCSIAGYSIAGYSIAGYSIAGYSIAGYSIAGYSIRSTPQTIIRIALRQSAHDASMAASSSSTFPSPPP